MINGGRWAKVLKVHPEAHAVDIVYLDTGARVPMVPVLAGNCSTNTGMIDLPVPTPPADDYGVKETKDRDVYAAVVPFGGIAVVIGFKVPEVGQMTFADPNLKITRHASDVYTVTDGAGNFEFYHPSGTFFAVSATGAHIDRTATDFDKKWKIAKNTAAAVHVHLSVANAGTEVAAMDVSPTGNLVGTFTGTGSLTFTGTATIKAPTITLDGAVHITGAVTADSTVTATGDVIGNGTHLHTHTHSGVTTGGGNTGAPL